MDRRTRNFTETLLSVENISLSFGGVKALTDISFDIARGEIRAIIGPNGAGKSTRFHLVSGRFPVSSGKVELKGEDITLYGDGMQTRAFCYVDDQIDGWLRLMDHTPDEFTGPVNIGNPVEITVKELAERIVKIVNGKSKIVHARPLPVDDPLQRCPDITLARKELKWEPKVQLDEGLTKTVQYFDALLKSNTEVSRVGR